MSNITWAGSKVKQVRSTDEIKSLLKSDGPCMIVFYMDTCTHCKAVEPEWKKLSNMVDGKATIYAIESADYNGGDVSGFPTMKIVKGGKNVLYEGDRSAESMKDALLKGNLTGGKRPRRRGTRRLRKRARKTHRALR